MKIFFDADYIAWLHVTFRLNPSKTAQHNDNGATYQQNRARPTKTCRRNQKCNPLQQNRAPCNKPTPQTTKSRRKLSKTLPQVKQNFVCKPQ